MKLVHEFRLCFWVSVKLTPTCRPLGEVETVGVVNFRTTGLLTGNHLSSVSTAETLILSFFGHHHLLLPLAVASPLTTFVFGWWVILVLEHGFIRPASTRHHCNQQSPLLNSEYLRPDAQEAAAVWRSTLTNGLPVSQTFQVVVEGELCAWDRTTHHFYAQTGMETSVQTGLLL